MLECPAAGFYTEEIRTSAGRHGSRLGFDVVALDGPRGPLARVGSPGPRVGKYGVDVRSFDEIGLRALQDGLKSHETLLVLDELGKMEFLSPAFVAVLPHVFQGPNPVLGTVMERRHPVADRFRRGQGVKVIRVSADNRDALPAELASAFSM